MRTPELYEAVEAPAIQRMDEARTAHADSRCLGACRAYFRVSVAGSKSADARREAQRISSIFASRATRQPRFLTATRRDGASWAHFGVARPRRTIGTPSGSRLELRPTRLRRIRESKPDRLLASDGGLRGNPTRGANRLRKLVDRRRIEPAAVVARDHIEVVARDPEARAVVRVFLQQQHADGIGPEVRRHIERHDAVGGPRVERASLGQSAGERSGEHRSELESRE